MESSLVQIGSGTTLIPSQKNCKLCKKTLYDTILIDSQKYFYCFDCNFCTIWSFQTLLSKTTLHLSTIEILLEFYINNKSKRAALNDMEAFFQRKISIEAITKYFTG